MDLDTTCMEVRYLRRILLLLLLLLLPVWVYKSGILPFGSPSHPIPSHPQEERFAGRVVGDFALQAHCSGNNTFHVPAWVRWTTEVAACLP